MTAPTTTDVRLRLRKAEWEMDQCHRQYAATIEATLIAWGGSSPRQYAACVASERIAKEACEQAERLVRALSRTFYDD